MPLRALGVDGGSSFDVIQAVRYAAGLSNDSGTLPARPADIINLSLGSSFFSQSEQSVYDQVRARGIIVIASAGNESTSAPSYPAGYDGVVSVSFEHRRCRPWRLQPDRPERRRHRRRRGQHAR
jgi:serine protease